MKKSWIPFVLLVSAISIYAANANKLALKGHEAYQQGEFKEAISYYLKAIQADPQVGDYFRLLGGAYYMNEQYQEAVDAGKKALSLPHEKDVEYNSWMMKMALERRGGK